MKKIGLLSFFILMICRILTGCAIQQESPMQQKSIFPTLTGTKIDNYPVTGHLLLQNNDEMILISGSEVNYDNKFSFDFPEGFHKENSFEPKYLYLFSMEQG